MATTTSTPSSVQSYSWALRCSRASSPSASRAARVRTEIGCPSMECVPELDTSRPGAHALAMAAVMTERAAFPVQTKWTCMGAGDGPSRRSGVLGLARRLGLGGGLAHADGGLDE